jgi:adenylate cyclase
MFVEIERKFLVANDGWKRFQTGQVALRDGLIGSFDGRKVRVRISGERATLTIKGPRRGIARDEFEYEIPLDDALLLLSDHCQGKVLEKTRHFAPFKGFSWIVDVYSGILNGVVLAEVELPSVDAVFDLPPWVGREITGEEQYRNETMLDDRLSALIG